MRLISILIVGFLFVGCKPDPIPPPAAAEDLNNGVLVLCEGLFQQNNSSISWVNFADGKIDNSFFVTRTNLQIGDTGNDMKRYGGKIYVVVNVSSTIEVLSASDFTPIKQISMQSGGTAKQPRSITFHGSNAYVSCYDGYVDVIDTATLMVTDRIQVGSNPEGVAIANGKLYVANSGGLNFPNVDTTVSVIDLISNTEISKITVGANPGALISDADGDLYVIVRGDYGAIPSRLKRINTTSDILIETFPFDATGVSKKDDLFLVHDNNSISMFDPASETLSMANFVDMTEVVTLYNVSFNPFDQKIYVSDAMNYSNSGYLRKFDLNGNYISSFHVGLNPSKVLFYD